MLHGKPLLLHAVQAATAAPVGRVIVVASEARRVRAIVRNARLRHVFVIRTRRRGAPLAASLAAGIAALRPIERDAFVFLGDMPRVDPTTAARLVRVMRTGEIARPRHRGVPGHPVLIRNIRAARPGRGDAGFGRDPAAVTWTEGGPACIADVDRRGDLARARRALPQPERGYMQRRPRR